MSGRRSKKNQRLGSSRRGPKGLTRNTEKDDGDDGLIEESEYGQNQFQTTTDSIQFDHPPSPTTDQQSSTSECATHSGRHEDLVVETENPERRRKMGSARKSGGFKVERKLYEEHQLNASTTEKQDDSLEKPGEPCMMVSDRDEEKDAILHQKTTSHSYEAACQKPKGNVTDADLLQEHSVMFDKLNAQSYQETPLANTSGQKRRMGSVRRPLGGRSMTENERKEEVIYEANSEEMAQTWGDVAIDHPSSHAELTLVLNQSLLAELKEPDVSAGTETMNQTVAFPLVDPEKPLHETSSHHGPPAHNQQLDFTFGVQKVLEEAGSILSDNSNQVPDTKNGTSTSYECRDVNTEEAKEEPFRNDQTSALSLQQDAQLEELALNDEKLPSVSQDDCASLDNACDRSTPQLVVGGGSTSFDVPASISSLAEPTTASSPHEMSNAGVELKQGHNVCDVASATHDTNLGCITEEDEELSFSVTHKNESVNDKGGSEANNAFEMTKQGDVIDHNVKHVMDVRDDDEEGVKLSTEIPQDENKKVGQYCGETENEAIQDVGSNPEEIFSFEATNTGHEKEGNDFEECEKAGILFSAESEYHGKSEETVATEKVDFILDVENKLQTDNPIDINLESLQVSDKVSTGLFLRNVAVADSDEVPEGRGISPVHPEEYASESQENAGDSEVVPVGGDTDLEIQTENLDSSIGEVLETEKNICHASALVREVEVSENTVESTRTTESDVLQTNTDVNVKRFENPENEGQREDIHKEEAHSKSNSTLQKRKMGSTRRPLKGNKGQRRGIEFDDENEKLDHEGMISAENEPSPDDYISQSSMDSAQEQEMEICVKIDVGSESTLIQSSCSSDLVREESSPLNICNITESESLTKINEESQENAKTLPADGDTEQQQKGQEHHDENDTPDCECTITTFSLEDQPSLDESTLRISMDRAEEQEMEICVFEGPKSDLVSEEPNIPASETLTIINEESLEKCADAERVAVDGSTDLQLEIESQNQTFDTSGKTGGTEDTIHDVNVLVREAEVVGESVTVENNVTAESDSLQNDTSADAKLEAMTVSENTENVSAVTDSGLLVQDVSTQGSGETDTIPEQSGINLTPGDVHREEANSEPSPVVQRRKMGSTRRPLKGNKATRKGRELHDENDTLDSEYMINVEKPTLSLDDQSTPDESTLQSSMDGAEEQKIEIFVKNNVGLIESSESALMQPSYGSDLVSEESTALIICNIPESETLTINLEESWEKIADAERVAIEGRTDLQLQTESQNQTFDTSGKAGGIEDSIHDVNVLVREAEVVGKSVTVENNVTAESDSLQNDTSADAKLEAIKASENTENVSAVTDSGLLVQDDSTQGSGETDTIPEQSGINLTPGDVHREKANSESSPVVQRRKMGSTRRPLRGNKATRKGRDLHDESDTLDSEYMINAEKPTLSLDDQSNPDESTLQSLMDGAEEQKLEICVKNNVGLIESSESDLMQPSYGSDLVSEKSTALSICNIPESETLTINLEESCEKIADAERVAVDGSTDLQLETESQDQTFDTSGKADGTEDTIHDVNVLVREAEVVGESVTVENNVTAESDSLQNDTSADAKLEAIKASENTENVSAVTDSGLLAQDDSTQGSGETDTIPEQSGINFTPGDVHRDNANSESSPVVQRRKMGSTRRPLKGNKATRKGRELHDENDSLDSEYMINVEKPTLSLDDQSNPDESTLQSSMDGAEEQKMEIFVKNNVGLIESSESALMQPLYGSDLVSEESTALSICNIPESETPTINLEESWEKIADAERVAVDGSTDLQLETESQNQTFDTSGKADGTEDTIHDVNVLVREAEVVGESVTVENNVTAEPDLLQSNTSADAKLEAMKASENTENVSAVTDSGLLEQDDSTQGSGETDTIPKQSGINLTPGDVHREKANSESSPVVQRRKMGSTRRPLKGNKATRKGRELHDENDTLDSEYMINVEKPTRSLDDQSTPDESTLQSSMDGAEEQKMEIFVKNNVGLIESSESALMQPSYGSDLVSEESTALSICNIPESETLTINLEESWEKIADAERVAVDGSTDLQLETESQNQTFDTSSKADGTEDTIHDVNVLVREAEVVGESVTVENNVTAESDSLQNDTSADAKLEAMTVSENTENVSAVTDSGLLVQDVSTQGSGETDTIPEQSGINLTPGDVHREEANSEPSPVVQRRKMGSTWRPLKGNKATRKGRDLHDENDTLDSEYMINEEKPTLSLDDQSTPDESTLQSSMDGAEEQKIEIFVKNNVGLIESSESALMQPSYGSDLVSEESTALIICNIPESETLTINLEESWEKIADAERVAIEGRTDLQLQTESQNQTFDTSSKAGGIEDSIHDVNVLVREAEVVGESVTVENNVTAESDSLQNDTSADAKLEAIKASENTENVSAVTDSGLLVQDDSTQGSGETDTIPEQSGINLTPGDVHRDNANSESSPVVQRRKMGSTRRPLKGNKATRKGRELHDENDTLDSEYMINIEKPTLSLDDQSNPDESTLQSSMDGAEEQKIEIFVKYNVGLIESSESVLMQSSYGSDLVSEESTALSICNIPESETLTINLEESSEKIADAERVAVDGSTDLQLETESQNQTFDTSGKADGTEDTIHDVNVLVREAEVVGESVTVENNVTAESDSLQNDTSADAKLEAMTVSENTENVSAVTDSGLLEQDDSTQGSGETDTIPKQSGINLTPGDVHREEANSESSPVVQRRKMGSTRRPLKGNKATRKGRDFYDENDTLDSEYMINVEKPTLSLDDQSTPDESTLQSSMDGAEEQKMEIFVKNNVGLIESSESVLMQSSYGSDLVSEESTALSICNIPESETLTINLEESWEKIADAERVAVDGSTDLQLEIESRNQTFDTSGKTGGTEDTIHDVNVLVREAEVVGESVTVENNVTAESDSLQNDTSADAKLEAMKASENTENVSAVTDSGLLEQDDSTQGSGETDTIPKQSGINLTPGDVHREEANSESSPVVQRRKMGSTRRPLKGNKATRKGRELHDENDTLDSEYMINVEKPTLSLDDQSTPDESTLQSSMDGAEEQKMEIFVKNNVGLIESSESALMQSSYGSDLVSEESTALSICNIPESETLTINLEESWEKIADAERVAVDGSTDLQLEIESQNQTFDTSGKTGGTEDTIHDVNVLVREAEVVGESVTVENNVTAESDSLQNDTSADAKLEAIKASENTENVSAVTDSGLLAQDDSTQGSGETDTIPEQSGINLTPGDVHREKANSESSPVVQRRKMGSTRRPLKGNKATRKGRDFHDENDTLDSECIINVEKPTLSLDDQSNPDESTLQSSMDGAEEQKLEIFVKNNVGLIESSESALMQPSYGSDLVSEESTALSICNIPESETLTINLEESWEKIADAERVAVDGSTDLQLEIESQNQTFDTSGKTGGTEDTIHDVNVLVRKAEVVGESVTVENNVTAESDSLQNDTSADAKLEAMTVSENTENVSAVTDSGLLVQDVSTQGSGETDTIPEQSGIHLTPGDVHREEANSEPSPVVQRRKMGSTRRPLKGNKATRKGRELQEENDSLDSEYMINVEKPTLSLDDQSNPDESTLQSSMDGAEEQKLEICVKNYVGLIESSESDLMQPSYGSDLVSEESTALSICNIPESETLTINLEESLEKCADAERVAVDGSTDLQLVIESQNQTFDTSNKAGGSEDSIHDVNVLVREAEVVGESVTVENNVTAESDSLQNDTSADAKLEAIKASENTENVSAVTDSGLLAQDDSTQGSGETDTIPEQSGINLTPGDVHREKANSESSPVVQRRKMGSTRRPLKGNKATRKGRDFHDENDTLDSECIINVEKPTLSLDDQSNPDESALQSSMDGAEERKIEIFVKNNVGLIEGSESALMQSSYGSDLMSEESTALSICNIPESETLTINLEESWEKFADAERVAVDGSTDLQLEIESQNQTFDTSSKADGTEDSIHDVNVLVREAEVVGESVTVENNVTAESDSLQNDTSADAKLEAIKASENTENVSAVTDSGLLVQDDSTQGSGETDTIPEQSGINLTPGDVHREKANSESSPVVQRRKMGSTRRPLKGNKATRKGEDLHEENHSECTIIVEKPTFSLDDQSNPDECMIQSSINEAEEQKLEICVKNNVGLTERSESALMQSSYDLDLVSEESIPEQSGINLTRGDVHGEKANSESSPVVQRRKMGSTRRPLKGNKGLRKGQELPDENDTPNSEIMSDVQTETFSLENKGCPDESTLQSIKDASDVQGSGSALIQSYGSDLVSEECSGLSICNITEIQEETWEDFGAVVEDQHSENKATFNPLISDPEGTEENMPETGWVREVETLNETVTEESNTNTEPYVLQTPLNLNAEALKVSINAEEVNSGDTVLKQSNINTVHEGVNRGEAQPKLSPAVQKRKMGSTRRTLRGNKGQIKDHEEKEILILENERNPDESMTDISEALPLETFHEESLENAGEVKKAALEGDTEPQTENKTIDSTASEAEARDETICEASVLVREVEFIGVTVDMTAKSDLFENAFSPNAKQEISDNTEHEVPVETNTFPKQSAFNIIPEDTHREEANLKLSPVVQKRKMGSTRKTLKVNKGQRNVREGEAKSEEEDTGTHSKIKDQGNMVDHNVTNKDEDVSVQELCDYVSQAHSGPSQDNLLEVSEKTADFVRENLTSTSQCDLVLSDSLKETHICLSSEDNVMGDSGGPPTEDSNRSRRKMGSTRKRGKRMVNEADVEEKEGEDKNTSIDDGASKSLAKANTSKHLESKSSSDDVPEMAFDNALGDVEINIVPEESVNPEEPHRDQSNPVVQKRKMGSTRKTLRGNKGQRKEEESKNMNEESEGMTQDQDTEPRLATECKFDEEIEQKKTLVDVANVTANNNEMKKAENQLDEMHSAQPTEVPPGALSSTDLKSHMLDLKDDKDYHSNCEPENTLQICADTTQKTVTIEKRRKMGSTRKNLGKEGRIQRKRDGYEDTETIDTNLTMPHDSEISLSGRAEETQDYSNQSEDSLLGEIQRALTMASQSSLNYELIVNESNTAEIESLSPSQSLKTLIEPNSPGRRRRKMGSTRKNPRQQLNAEREDETEENLETNKQEKKDLEVTVNPPNKEYFDVPSAHTSSLQEQSANPVDQEKTSPSTKRKFGSRRANKGKQGLGRLVASDSMSESKDGDHKPDGSAVEDSQRNDGSEVCGPSLSLQPESQLISRNDEAAPKGTGRVDQVIKQDRSPGTRQTINLKNTNSGMVQFNVVMVGNSCVGKTSFIRRFHEGQFTEDYRSTIGVDTFVQTVELPDRTVKLQIWDTAGQERFHSITTQVFHKADGLLLMYEITCSKSFISVRDWISQAREKAPDDAIMMLLGNKNDSVNREVQVQEGADLAREYNIHFMECSAATGENVSESMKTLAELLVQRKRKREEHTMLRREPLQKKSGCC